MGYKYLISYAPSGRAQCKSCGKLIKQDSLRISRESGPIAHFGGDAGIIQHYHYKHAFDAMLKSRCTTNTIMSTSNLKGFSGLLEKDKKAVQKEVDKFSQKWKKRCPSVARSASKKRSARKSTRKSTRIASRKRLSSRRRRSSGRRH